MANKSVHGVRQCGSVCPGREGQGGTTMSGRMRREEERDRKKTDKGRKQGQEREKGGDIKGRRRTKMGKRMGHGEEEETGRKKREGK